VLDLIIVVAESEGCSMVMVADVDGFRIEYGPHLISALASVN